MPILEDKGQFDHHFNCTHSLDDIVQYNAEPLDLTGVPTKLEDVDLRFLHSFSFGDTYDGGSSPSDGTRMKVIMYGDKVVFKRFDTFYNGSQETGVSVGNEMFRDWLTISRVFLKIQEIVVEQYDQRTGGRRSSSLFKKGSDSYTVFISSKNLKLLKQHQQFKDLVETVSAVGVIEIIPTGVSSQYRVQITKK